MKPKAIIWSIMAAMLVGTGCSTVQSRIQARQAEFNSWPPPVQQMVSAGRVGIGFTTEQVRVALGNPDHAFARTSVTGSYEVWTYHDRGPRFGFGIGMASFHGGSAYGGGVSATTGGYRGERIRVIFDQTGRVSSIEQVQR